MTTTGGTMYGDIDSKTRTKAVLLQLEGQIDRDFFGDELCGPAANTILGVRSYKGGADQLFVTYELEPEPGDEHYGLPSYPQALRVYLSGELSGWEIGVFKTRSGAEVYGVKIEYERTRETYRTRDEDTEYESAANSRRYTKIIEIPARATAIELRAELPDRYRHALHLM